jgi:hypothetical protein
MTAKTGSTSRIISKDVVKFLRRVKKETGDWPAETEIKNMFGFPLTKTECGKVTKTWRRKNNALAYEYIVRACVQNGNAKLTPLIEKLQDIDGPFYAQFGLIPSYDLIYSINRDENGAKNQTRSDKGAHRIEDFELKIKNTEAVMLDPQLRSRFLADGGKIRIDIDAIKKKGPNARVMAEAGKLMPDVFVQF